MALPWIIGGAAVVAGKLIYDAVTEDSSSSSSSDRDYREREAKQRAKEEKNEKIRHEINEYKENQSSKIKKKYGATIAFISEDSTENNINDLGIIWRNSFNRNEDKVKIISKDKSLQNKIINFQKETKEIKESLEELEAIRNEIFK